MEHKDFIMEYFMIDQRTQQDILKGKKIRKLEDGGDMFEDYWTDSDDESSILNQSKKPNVSSKPLQLLNVETSNLISSNERNCSFRKKPNHSPVKSQEVLCNDCVNVVEVENLNKRSCTDVFEGITANLEVNGDDQQIEALKTVLNNDDKNNSSSELVEIASTVLEEIQVINNSPLSQTHTKKNEMPQHISRISFKTSKKFISRSTRIDPKLHPPQLQYDEYDEQIMLMVHAMKKNETIIPSSSKKEVLLTPQPSFVEVVKENIKAFEKSQQEESTIKKSVKNVSKISQKIKNSRSRKNTTVSKRSIIDENILQAAHSDDSSQLQTTKRQKKSANERNSSVSEKNFIASMSRNTFDSHSVSSVSEINVKKTQKKKKNKNNESRQTAATNDNYFPSVGNNCVVVDLDNFSGLSEQQISKKRKKVSKKSIFTSLKNSSIKAQTKIKQMIPVRRSSRVKYQPLAHWRNERLLFRFEDGEIKTLGIDKGTKEDLGALQQLCNNKKLQKKEKIMKPKKAKVLDVIQKREKFMEVQKKFPLVPWDLPNPSKTNRNSEPDFLVKRMFETKGNSFGYLKIGVGKSKPPQFMPEDDLQLTVIYGTLDVHIHKQVYTLESKDMFIVPRSSSYSIINIGKKTALLSYAVGKFKFL